MESFTLAERLRMMVARRLRVWACQSNTQHTDTLRISRCTDSLRETADFFGRTLTPELRHDQAEEIKSLMQELRQDNPCYAQVIHLHYVSELTMSNKLARLKLDRDQYQHILKKGELWLAKRIFKSLTSK